MHPIFFRGDNKEHKTSKYTDISPYFLSFLGPKIKIMTNKKQAKKALLQKVKKHTYVKVGDTSGFLFDIYWWTWKTVFYVFEKIVGQSNI